MLDTLIQFIPNTQMIHERGLKKWRIRPIDLVLIPPNQEYDPRIKYEE